MFKLKSLFLCLLASALAGSTPVLNQQEVFFTIAILPDTQYYTESPFKALTYYAQTQYIVSHKAELNVKFVIHLGDITDDNQESEWKIAKRAHRKLEDAKIPYSVSPGNHDYPHHAHGGSRNSTLFNRYFPISRLQTNGAFKEGMGGKSDNNYSFFEVGNLKFMIISLEFAPTKNAVCWANDIIRANPDRRVIIATHCYQKYGGAYCNCTDDYEMTGSNGEDLWSELVRRHSNIFMVLSGHITDAEKTVARGFHNNKVYQILTDFQNERDNNDDKNGMGWMRTLTFYPASGKIVSKTFSVLDGVTELTEPQFVPKKPGAPGDNVLNFTIDDYDMITPPTYQFEQSQTWFNDMTVNTSSRRNQRAPDIAMNKEGKFVVVWEDDSRGEEGVYQIYGRGFDPGGCERFKDIVINANGSGQQRKPAVSMASNGNFVVAWEDDSDENSKYQIYAAIFNANGTKRMADFNVNTVNSGQQRAPAVAMAPNGNFVVTWQDDNDNNGKYQIYAARYDANGSKIGNDFTVNATSSGQQLRPKVSVNKDGKFAIVWEDDSDGNGYYQIKCAIFDETGSKTKSDFTVNSISAGQQLRPALSMDQDGNFIVAWQDDSNQNHVFQIKATGFRLDGNRFIPDFTVNSNSSGQQISPCVSFNGNEFVIAWSDDSNSNNKYNIYGAGFDNNGTRIFPDLRINKDFSGLQGGSRIAIDQNGNYVTVWQDNVDSDDDDGNNWYQILARGIDKRGRGGV